jgi:hypothetical protein
MEWGKKNKIIERERERDMIKRNRFEEEKLRCFKKRNGGREKIGKEKIDMSSFCLWCIEDILIHSDLHKSSVIFVTA